jgi:hypothetical protein
MPRQLFALPPFGLAQILRSCGIVPALLSLKVTVPWGTVFLAATAINVAPTEEAREGTVVCVGLA